MVQQQVAASILDITRQPRPATLLAMAILATILTILSTAQAQTFTVLHDFAGPDGSNPYAGLTMGRGGNLYGTTSSGGRGGGGTVFELTPRNSAWLMDTLHAFSGPDGASPTSRVVIGPDGNLYGTTSAGGAAQKGTVFKLTPQPSVCRAFPCAWRETVLHSFAGGSDGANPNYGDLAFDSAGNIYGTTSQGGALGCGTVYQLSPGAGGWTENVLYNFRGAPDGQTPYAGVILDAQGNLYGTTEAGGSIGVGTVYELSHTVSGWTETILYDFPNAYETDGGFPFAGLIFDRAGNLYGTTSTDGALVGGTAYELSPSSGGWVFSVLHSFNAYLGSVASLTMDAAGNLYGTLAFADAKVFRLSESGGHWSETDFNVPAGDTLFGSVIVDGSGNLYTTAVDGGAHGDGFVFEIAP